jgi:hypothetical protein
MIKYLYELKEFFQNNPETSSVKVNTKMRNNWMLYDETVIIKGNVRELVFKSLGGGIWEARLKGK